MHKTNVLLIALTTILASCGSGVEQERQQLQNERDAFEQQKQAEAERKAAEKTQERKEFVLQMNSMNAVLEQISDMYTNHPNDETLVRSTFSAMDLSNCPSDFVTAFSNHREALFRMYNIENSRNELNSDENKVRTLIQVVSKWETSETPFLDHLSADSQYDKEFKQAASDFKVTHDNIAAVVDSYKAQLDQMVKEKKEEDANAASLRIE